MAWPLLKGTGPADLPPLPAVHNPPTPMKAQLISLLLFAAPLMLQVLLCDKPAATEPAAPAGPDAPAKEAPAALSSATKAEPVKTPPPPATRAPRLPAKLAPWLM